MSNVAMNQETITPELAKKYLESNVGNRKPIRSAVHKYSADMENDNWQMTGDTIKFDEQGVLIDGQNRLMAVVQCGKAQVFWVARGLSTNAKMATDIGAPRTINHMFEFNGEKNTAVLSGICRFGLAQERGAVGVGGRMSMFSVAEIVDFLDKNPLCRDASQFSIANADLRTILGPVVMGFTRFITMQIDLDLSNKFFDLIDVCPEKRNHPCRVLKEKIVNTKLKSKRGVAISQQFVLANTIKAWNAFYKGKDIAVLRYSNDESFPQFEGYPPIPNQES